MGGVAKRRIEDREGVDRLRIGEERLVGRPPREEAHRRGVARLDKGLLVLRHPLQRRLPRRDDSAVGKGGREREAGFARAFAEHRHMRRRRLGPAEIFPPHQRNRARRAQR